MTNLLELFDELIQEEGDFTPLFRGENKYEFVCRWADVPTDWSLVASYVYLYYKSENCDPKIIDMCRDSLIKMTKKSPIDAWCAFNTLYYLTYPRHGQDSVPFDIVTDELIESFETGLLNYKEELKSIKKYTCPKSGLWVDVLRLVELIKKTSGVEINLKCSQTKTC